MIFRGTSGHAFLSPLLDGFVCDIGTDETTPGLVFPLLRKGIPNLATYGLQWLTEIQSCKNKCFYLYRGSIVFCFLKSDSQMAVGHTENKEPTLLE